MLLPLLFQARQKGQGLVEYAIIVIVVVIVAVSVGILFNGQITNLFSALGSIIKTSY